MPEGEGGTLTPNLDLLSSTPQHLVCYQKALLLSPFTPLKLLPPVKKRNLGAYAQWHSPWTKKALSGCLLQLSLPVSHGPQCLGEAGRETQIQFLLGA